MYVSKKAIEELEENAEKHLINLKESRYENQKIKQHRGMTRKHKAR